MVTVKVNNASQSWVVDHRFSEFVKLCDEVKKLNKSAASKFPSRFSALLPRGESALIQQRKNSLNEFLAAICREKPLLAFDSVVKFLKLDEQSESSPSKDGGDEQHIPLGIFDRKKSSPADFRFIKVVGKGSFAKVLQAEHLAEGKLYAIKVIDKQDVVRRREVRHVMAERSILQRNKQHPFLVRLHYAFQTRDKLYFVLDFVNGGELFHHLQKDRRFSLERTRFYACEIASALGFLHSQNIIYRDLKPENILLDSEGHIVLTDFGLCREGDVAGTFCGTPEYLAPEVLKKERYTRAVDWWCLGCVTFEMLCGLPPFYSRDHQKMYNAILNDNLSFPAAASLPADAKAMLTGLLDKDPLTRMGSSKDLTELQSHPFFAAVNWDRIVRKELTPPFRPRVANAGDVTEIDAEFTNQPIPESVRQENDTPDPSSSYANQFQGFTFVPPSDMQQQPLDAVTE